MRFLRQFLGFLSAPCYPDIATVKQIQHMPEAAGHLCTDDLRMENSGALNRCSQGMYAMIRAYTDVKKAGQVMEKPSLDSNRFVDIVFFSN